MSILRTQSLKTFFGERIGKDTEKSQQIKEFKRQSTLGALILKHFDLS